MPSALQRDIARTVACGLRLDDEGFHPTVLVYGGHRHPVGGGDPPGAAAGPGRVWVELSAHDDDRPGKPNCAWNDPQATKALGLGLVNDALAVLAAVADLELDAEQDDAVALLALVAGQDVEPDQRPGTWRIARRVAADRVISTVDPTARHTRKTSARKRDGGKAHIAAEPETGLVTGCALTAATAPTARPGSGCWPARRRA
jgi:hypothetical protein